MSIAIVDDQGGGASAMGAVLEAAGMHVTTIHAGAPIDAWAFDVILLVAGAAARGADTCRRLRAASHMGAIIAVGVDRAAGVALLEAGADDFVLAPPSPLEIAARVRAALRREAARWQSRWGELVIDHRRRVGSLRGAVLPLTSREYGVLAMLVEARGGVVSRDAILKRVWDRDADGRSNFVEAHVSRLRDKLGRDARLISTVRGAGYRLSR